MGTPEFPDLGKHCSVEECKQIDFLPFTCDRCRQVYCLDHRSYIKHNCPKADKKDVTVVICPLCAKGVRLNPDEDPNISWEAHVSTDCNPSNYEKVTKKKKCPVPGCKELLTFSNTIRCRDCTKDHCLKHRFGLDHKCPGPKKPEAGFPFISMLSSSKKEGAKSTSSSRWSGLLSAASKLSTDISQAWQSTTGGSGGASSSSSSASGRAGTGQTEECPQCGVRFPSVTALVEHVQKVHEKNNSQSRVFKMSIDVCPRCNKGFRDAVALVEHVEREHRGTSKA